jgi:von Willebrand factor type A C-terminal domain/von Willebrand factor type A domain
MDFAMEAFQNEYLPLGGTTVDAVLTVASGGEDPADTSSSATPERTAVVVIIDGSGSMAIPRAKIRAARLAARAAIEALPDGVHFAVLSGTGLATSIYPPEGLAVSSPRTRMHAGAACRFIRASGGTAMSAWLNAARHLLAPFDGAVRQVILLTDGKNEGEKPPKLERTVEQCAGVFQCDCRGVGADWSVPELRMISSGLSGSLDIVAEPDDLVADFESIVRRTAALRAADVRLRVAVSPGTGVLRVAQVAPSIEDLMPKATYLDDRCVEVPLGAWRPEEREYHVRLTVAPRAPGDELLAARVGVVHGQDVVATALLRARWTDDPATATVINERVAHATGQQELASAITEGLAARSAGDVATATERLGRAVQLAVGSSHHETLRLLARVVHIDDATTGTVRLKRNVDLVDEMTLDARSTKTVRIGRGS